MAHLSIRNLTKSYQTFQAVRGIDLEIADSEFVALVGPSGCGKSTTLRMIAGLETISGGEIRIDDQTINDVEPGRRDIAMVFQNYALYPHMTVYDNIAFGLRQRRMPKAEVAARVAEAARVLEIEPLLKRKPRMLSGGQRQRVAMGRAIVRNPKVFLFDEPLSNLDAKLRVQMRTEIKRLHQQIPTTTVYVTHDQIEAMTMADRVVVMNNGTIEQAGPPQELYNRPVSRFVAGFIGSPAMNFLDGRLVGEGDGLFVQLPGEQRLAVPASRRDAYAPFTGRDVVLGLRPEAFSNVHDRPNTAALSGTVDLVEPLGAETLLYMRVGTDNVCARVAPSYQAAPKQTIALTVDMDSMHLIDPATDKVIY
jgi:multiple sugar transport system ATP-binding protein